MSLHLGVCSWSVQPSSPADLVEKVRSCGLSRIQLALEPLVTRQWDEGATTEALRAGGITLASGMLATFGEDYTTPATIRETGGIRPDQHWSRNFQTAKDTAAAARRLGIGLVTFHAGFLPEEPGDPERKKLVDRLRAVADAFASKGVALGLETGQETAATLLEVLEELNHPGVGVNFDPANMILYDKGNPVDALRLLAPHVKQIHIKDAVASKRPGAWGDEVTAGTGQVEWVTFFGIASKLGIQMMIEREAGNDRIGDIRAARALVQRHLGELS